MFEKIHFYEMDVKMMVSLKGTSNVLRGQFNPADSDTVQLSDEQIDITSNKNSRYCLDGHSSFIELLPVNDDIRASLCYLLSFSVMDMTSRHFTNRMDSDNYEILYTLEGGGLLRYGGKEWPLKAGNGFMIDCRKPHYYRTEGERWKYVVIHLRGPMVDTLYKTFSTTHPSVFYEPVGGVFSERLETLARHCDRRFPYQNITIAEDLVSMMFYLSTLPASGVSDYGKKKSLDEKFAPDMSYLVRYIEQHYTEKLSLDFLSEFSGISKYHMSREFKIYTGFSPIDYIVRLRINHAKDMLSTSDKPVNEIASDVGIDDAQYFSHLFKKNEGMTPGAYRKANRTTIIYE